MVDTKQTKTADGENCHRRHYNDLVDRMISQIKAGIAPWQKPWKPGRRLLAVGRRPRTDRAPDAAPDPLQIDD